MESSELAKLDGYLDEVPQIELNKIFEQFERDMARGGCVEYESHRAFETLSQLFDFVHKIVSSIFMKNSQDFWQLIYIIDLPEVVVSEIVSNHNDLQYLSKLILYREWQKIQLRKRYSGQ